MHKMFLQHITEYTYNNKVSERANQLKLYPFNDRYQQIINHIVEITSNPLVEKHTDFFGNTVGTFTMYESHNYLKITSKIEFKLLTFDIPNIQQSSEELWHELDSLRHSLDYYLFFQTANFLGADQIKHILSSDYKKEDPFTVALKLCEYVYKNFAYQKGITTVDSTLDEVWKLKSGVCQDFTNILLQICRFYGIPTRYVSGYICPSDTSKYRGEGATHAWVEVYIPEHQWVGIDPTNNCIVSGNHLRLSIGRDYKDCSPVKGVYRGNADDRLVVTVKINGDNNFDENNPLELPVKRNGTVKLNSYVENQELILLQQQQQQQQ